MDIELTRAQIKQLIDQLDGKKLARLLAYLKELINEEGGFEK